jgi:hypothetical protein
MPASELPLPDFVNWSIFPFEGELRVKQPWPDQEHDLPRTGEGDEPCPSCARGDDEYLWVDDRWRVVTAERMAAPTVFLETREHLDLCDFTDEIAAEYGQLQVRLDRAFLASGGIGRTHMNRWGDGGAHFHLWCYGRPIGSLSMLGFGMPMWAQILPPLSEQEWHDRLIRIAEALAEGGGTVIGTTSRS